MQSSSRVFKALPNIEMVIFSTNQALVYLLMIIFVQIKDLDISI